MKTILKNLKTPIIITFVLILICGILYPLLMTGISQILFPHQANGSLVKVDNKVIGSELLGQKFTDDKFMKARPSAVNYNTYTLAEKKSGEYTGVASGSNNFGPSNPELKARVEADIEDFLKKNPTIKKENIPTDLMTASGSGLDPHISPASAIIQIPALVKTTGLSSKELNDIVSECTENKFLGIFGEDTVNVLKVNLMIAENLDVI